MSNNLYQERINKDIGVRSYYGKFIFNSHFLIFLTIAGGFFLYSLLGFVSNTDYNIWLDIIPSLLISLTLVTKYRSLLQQADQIFLPPFEKHMTIYFKRMSSYSMLIGSVKVILSLMVALLLYSVGNSMFTLIMIMIYTAISYVMGFQMRRNILNSDLNRSIFTFIWLVINVGMLMLMTLSPYNIVVGIVVLFLLKKYINAHMYTNIDWPTLIQHEERQMGKYYRNVSMFTNVKHIDKQFKRRAYLDRILWQPKANKFDKAHMYEFLFYRSFFRSHDLPMIILRLIIIFGLVMIWLSQPVLSGVLVLFGVYLIILQMSQLYTAQAYLLWPKIWPVKRQFIQESYIKYSHKVVFVITLMFSILFIAIHPSYFYTVIIFPVWGYMINHILSKNVYKKERLLSD